LIGNGNPRRTGGLALHFRIGDQPAAASRTVGGSATRLDLVFMDTTSLYFEGAGGQTLGQPRRHGTTFSQK
jgi:hypothetical protein